MKSRRKSGIELHKHPHVRSIEHHVHVHTSPYPMNAITVNLFTYLSIYLQPLPMHPTPFL